MSQSMIVIMMGGYFLFLVAVFRLIRFILHARAGLVDE